MIRGAISILAALALAGPIYGVATGLNIIPTADVPPPDTVDTDAVLDRSASDAISTAGLQVGLGGGTEAGYDITWGGDEDARAWNVKTAVTWRRREPVFALGLQNAGHHLEPQPYAVGRVPAGQGWLHAGLIRIEG